MTTSKDITERLRICGRLRSLRLEMGLTQGMLSELTGIDRSRISQIEGGRHSVSLDSLSRIAKALDSSVEIVKNQK